MKKMLKRGIALAIAATLICGQVAMPVFAEEITPADVSNGEVDIVIAADEHGTVTATASIAAENGGDAPQVTTGTVDVPSQLGGTSTEKLEVDIVTSTDENGNTTTKASTPEGGDETASGATVELESEKVTDATDKLLSEDTTYSGENGSLVFSGGTETSTQISSGENAGDLTVDLVEDSTGDIVDSATAGGNSTSETKEGSVLESDNPSNFDQTVTTTTDRKLEVEVQSSTTVSGSPAYTDENGNIYYLDENGNRVDTEPSYNGHDWYYTGSQNGISGKGTWYAVKYDENGNVISKSEALASSGVNEKKVANSETGEKMDSLYCTDISTGFLAYYVGYRKVNLEDAVEEGFYTAEEAAHLRAIISNGYTWDDHHKASGQTEDLQLEEIKASLTEAASNGDESAKALLAGMDIDGLTKEDAALATGMAVWHYGNRFQLEEDEQLVLELNGTDDAVNERRMQLYRYLISLTEESKETEIINEEKFIDDMTFTVGTKVEGDARNQDGNHTNDVYSTTLKFSMVVTPTDDDDLIVKVLDAQGNVVKEARIAGTNDADETYEDARTEMDADGKRYYVLDGLQLSENSNTSFNLKLEGTQLLKEGVYVFESEHYSDEEAADRLAAAAGLPSGEDYIRMLEESWRAEGKTEEEIAALVKAECDRINGGQSLIGEFSGTADVDVTIQIDMTFNVEEETVTTTHTWRVEEEHVPQTYNLEVDPTPEVIAPGEEEEEGEDTTILDEEVPLAAVPKTGDISMIWTVLGSFGLAGSAVLARKTRKNGEEEA